MPFSDPMMAYPESAPALFRPPAQNAPRKVVIVGAGIFGLITAKTYLQLYPGIDLSVVESDTSIGGTWSRNRIYPGLMTQGPEGLFEFSDEPLLVDGKQNVQNYVRAELVPDYLESYARKHGVLDRCRFGVWVESCRKKKDGGWVVKLAGGEEVWADRLIIATGVTSEAKMPDVLNRDAINFGKPVFHTKDLVRNLSILKAPETKDVLIYGGGKFGVDVANLALSEGKHVTWLIRPRTDGGRGMPGLFKAYVPVAGNLVAMINRRAAFALHPSIHDKDSLCYRFFHSGNSALGARILSWIQWFQTEGYRRDAASHPVLKDMLMHLHNDNIFWNINCLPIPQESFFSAVSNPAQVSIKQGTIASLSPSTVHLKDGSTLKPDVVIAATGWTATFPIFTVEQRVELGLPCPLDSIPAEKAQRWAKLDRMATDTLLSEFPLLRDAPQDGIDQVRTAPYRLYRHIAPLPSSEKQPRDIAFVGTVMSQASLLTSEIQALWTVAYLEDELELPTIEHMESSIAEQAAFMQKRYGAHGRETPCYIFEFVAYIDTLLGDLGLPQRRKKGKLNDLFSVVRPRDYRGIQEEWAVQRALARRKF